MEAALKDSELFKKNLERWSILCKWGKDAVVAANCEAFRFVPASSGVPNLLATFNGKEVFLHQCEDPLKEAHDWFQKLLLKNVTTLYVYGIGLGYYYDVAKEWLHASSDRSLVFLEDSPSVVHRFLETEQAHALLHDRQAALYLFNEQNPAFHRLDKIVFLYASAHPSGCATSFLQSYYETQEMLCNEVGARLAFFHTMFSSGVSEYLNISSPFFRNFFWNILYLPHSFYAAGLKDKFSGVPAIICGAGPSLNKNIALLRGLTDRALIFAGGTTLNALNVNHVLPHFGIGIDPNHAQFTRSVMNSACEVPFFYRTRMLHEGLELMHGERIYVPGNAGYEVGKWMEQQLEISSSVEVAEGFNVLNFSLGIAYLLGCSPIICVGIDLAYTDGLSYPSGLIPHPVHNQKTTFQTKAFEDDLISKRDIYGKPILTLWKWVAESLWYTNFSQQHPKLALINCTEGGIGFPTVPNMPLAEAKQIYLKKQFDFGSMIHAEIQNSAFPATVSALKIKALIIGLMHSLKSCQELSRKIFDLLSGPSPYSADEKEKQLGILRLKFEEEDAYQAILKPYHHYFQQSSALQRMQNELEEKSAVGEKSIDSAQFKALHDTSKNLEELVEKILTYVDETEAMAKQWQERHAPEIKELRLQNPVPTLKAEESYLFEKGVMTLIDPELGLDVQHAFTPMAEDIERSYYPSGILKAERHYKGGRLHGPSACFAENGQLLARAWFLEGEKEGKVWTYYPQGMVCSLQCFRQGLREGRQLSFYADGSIRSCSSYLKGELHGDYLLYHAKGFLERKLRFEQGKRMGKEQIWDARRILRIEAHFHSDRAVDTARIWHYNGVLAKELVYDQNSICLSVKQWDEFGMEIAEGAGEAKEDYFVLVTKKTEELTASLKRMVDQVAQALPLSKQKNSSINCTSELHTLQKEIERLKRINVLLRQRAVADESFAGEMIWKSQKIQHEMEKMIENLSEHLNNQIGNLGGSVDDLIKRIKKP